MRFLPLLLLVLAAFGTDLPPDASQAVAAYDKACSDIQAKADAAKLDLAKRLLPMMDASLKKATQAGNLDAAMTVKAKRDELASMFTPVLCDLHETSIVGVWSTPSYQVTVNRNKTAQWKSGNQIFQGLWSINKQKGEAQITWSNGCLTGLCLLPNGDVIVAEEDSSGNHKTEHHATKGGL